MDQSINQSNHSINQSINHLFTYSQYYSHFASHGRAVTSGLCSPDETATSSRGHQGSGTKRAVSIRENFESVQELVLN